MSCLNRGAVSKHARRGKIHIQDSKQSTRRHRAALLGSTKSPNVAEEELTQALVPFRTPSQTRARHKLALVALVRPRILEARSSRRTLLETFSPKKKSSRKTHATRYARVRCCLRCCLRHWLRHYGLDANWAAFAKHGAQSGAFRRRVAGGRLCPKDARDSPFGISLLHVPTQQPETSSLSLSLSFFLVRLVLSGEKQTQVSSWCRVCFQKERALACVSFLFVSSNARDERERRAGREDFSRLVCVCVCVCVCVWKRHALRTKVQRCGDDFAQASRRARSRPGS